jgi:acyl-CoA synthetase (AMP-forming)/AMP-acid ligase II
MARALFEFLARSACNAPTRTALVDASRRITYDELWHDAQAFGSYLMSEGLQIGDRVAIILANSIEYVIALYGATLAGGTAVPMSAVARRDELRVWLDHSQAAWTIHAAGNREALAAIQSLGRPMRCVVAASEPGGAATPLPHGPATGRRIEPRLRPVDQPSCILYTSGTTGRPKGVMLSDGNLSSNAEAIAGYLALTGSDIGLGLLPFSYSYGSSVLHSHIAAGATVVIARSFAYPKTVAEMIARERVTGFAGVASTYSLLLSRVRLADHDLSSVRYLTQAGGPIPTMLLNRLLGAFPGRDVYLMYGQTEATARLTYLPPHMVEHRFRSVGRPIAEVRIEIRDESGKKLPANAPGEVWASGPNIMLGYWRDEPGTNAVIRQSWLRTGDMGHLDCDGYLYLHGRRSDIIKVGEHSVYPHDIENAIAAFPGVQSVAAIGVDDGLLGQIVVAFVVPEGGMRPDVKAIRAHCRRVLAPYKVPKRIEFMDALPTGPSGKLLRRTLSEMGRTTTY